MVGFDVRNRTNIDQIFMCPVCSLILRDPIQIITCGHRQCQSCLPNNNQVIIKCPRCQFEIPKTEILFDRGFQNDMKPLPIDCSFCQWSGILENYQMHLDECHPSVNCEYCGEQFNSVNQFNEHKLLICQQRPIDCILKDFGCYEPIIRAEMSNHYLTGKHQEFIAKAIHQAQSELDERQMDTSHSMAASDSERLDAAAFRHKDIPNVINILLGGIEALASGEEHLSNESLRMRITIPTLEEELLKIKVSAEESNGFLEAVKYKRNILKQELISLQEKINDSQYVSYDGTLIWKITNVREKMMDAQSERQTSIYSPPFYSSLNGYKMRARLYLNGDGNARRTHMSLFFVLMRSVNDPILKFPFDYKVSFCLFDQTPAQRHVIDSFRPDIRSSSFQRPRTDMNIASGIPKFFPLTMIEQEGNSYIRDDTMFIKIMVDFGDMPKSLLSFALSLNPGIPMAVQQTMIKEEGQRRARLMSEDINEDDNVAISISESLHY